MSRPPTLSELETLANELSKAITRAERIPSEKWLVDDLKRFLDRRRRELLSSTEEDKGDQKQNDPQRGR